MPTYLRQLTHDALLPVPYQAESLADATPYEPHDGVYTITNTTQTDRVLKLDAHLDRLEASARQANIPLTLDRPRLRAALRQMIAEFGVGDVRFRITVPAQSPDTLLLSLEPFQPPSPAVYKQGVRVITTSAAARTLPGAKTTDWMHQRTTLEASLPQGVYTAILLSPTGELLEGLSSNFYAILDGELRSAATGILLGIAQQIVYTVAPSLLPVRQQGVTLADVPRLSEAFITSASRGIVPVVAIDDHTLGDGTPGPQTQQLIAMYLEWAQAHSERL
jgi:branched-chain amino acid aminotransferase